MSVDDNNDLKNWRVPNIHHLFYALREEKPYDSDTGSEEAYEKILEYVLKKNKEFFKEETTERLKEKAKSWFDVDESDYKKRIAHLESLKSGTAKEQQQIVKWYKQIRKEYLKVKKGNGKLQRENDEHKKKPEECKLEEVLDGLQKLQLAPKKGPEEKKEALRGPVKIRMKTKGKADVEVEVELPGIS